LNEKKEDEIEADTVDEQKSELFDLTMLEELDDNEYLSQMIEIFLNTTPEELTEMKKQMRLNEFESIQRSAHKLKSSVGLMKAGKLFNALVKLEKAAEAKNKSKLTFFISKALDEFHKLENPLKQKLEKIKTSLNVV
jgi:HPt (histidine-containing phosphotransfer) domain-containing protein